MLRRDPALDALRGVAITLVFALHCEAPINGFRSFWRTDLPVWRAFQLAGGTGVTLFFLLSGFLIGGPFLIEMQGGRRVVRTEYAMRRVRRIMPAYVVAVIVATLLIARSVWDFHLALPYLIFAHGFLPVAPVAIYSGVWWSLATEVQFYVALPLLSAWVCSRRARRLRWALTAVALVGYGAFATGMVPVPKGSLLQWTLVCHWPSFAMGIGVAWMLQRHGGVIRHHLDRLRFGSADLLLMAILYTLGVLLRWTLHFEIFALDRTFALWHVAEAALWGAVLLLVLAAPLVLRRLLVNPFWTTLGVLSYSIYLIHLPMQIAVFAAIRARYPLTLGAWHWRSLGVCLLAATLTVALATITYWLIERPFLRRKRVPTEPAALAA